MAANNGSQGIWILAAVVAVLGLRALPSSPAAGGSAQTASPVSSPKPASEEKKNDCAEKSCDAECSIGLDAVLTGFESAYGTKPRPAIALVADPVDSGLAYYFDATLEGMEAAFGDASTGEGWVRDRFYLPWHVLNAEGKPRTELESCRHSVPGLLLYRRTHDGRAEGLAVFLVGEASTWGIERATFDAAMRRVLELRPSEARVDIVGPTFSGTASSLSSALGAQLIAADAAGRPLHFKVRSGTATATSAAEALQALNGPEPTAKRVDYRSAAPEDDNLRCAMFLRLHERLRVSTHLEPRGQVLEGVALLSEGATAYGAGFRGAGARTECPVPEFEYAFPNLSDVRAAYGNAALTPLGFDLPLSRVDVSTAHDPLARIHPTLSTWTPVARDIGLATALSDLAVRSVHYVGLVATDANDITFLAERVKRQLPDVRLFAFENDVLFEHPAYATALNGMLVVHPTRVDQDGNPLSPPRLTNVRAREMVEGVYLAARDLLEEGQRIPRAIPEVSVVGNGKLWSIGPPLGKPPTSPLVPRVFWLLSAWLGAFALANGGAYLVQLFSPRARAHWSLLPLRALRPCQHADLAAAHSVRVFALLLVVLTPALLVHGISWPVPGFNVHRLLLLCGVLVNAAALVVALVDMLRAFLVRRLVPPTAWAYLGLALLVGAFTLFGVWPWAASAPPQRSVTLASSVSPILPVLLGAALVYLLVLCGLIRIRLLDTQLPAANTEPARGAEVAVPFQRLPLGIGRALGLTTTTPGTTSQLETDVQRLERRLVQSLHDPWSVAPRSVVLANVALIAGFALLFDAKPLLTFEETRWHGLLLATFVACLLVQALTFLQLWLYFAQLRMLLHRLARHPIAAALRRVPKPLLRPVEQQLLANRAEAFDLSEVVQVLGELSLLRPKLGPNEQALLPILITETALREAHETAENAVSGELARVASRVVPEGRVLKDTLLGVANALSLSLIPLWQRRTPPAAEGAERAAEPTSPPYEGLEVYAGLLSAPALSFLRHAETLIASVVTLQVLRYVRYFRYFVVALLSGAVLLVLMTALYALQPQRLLLNLELCATTVIVSTVLWMFFALDRDTTLSAIAGTTAGEVTLNGNLVTRIVTWGVLPMLSAIAAQYPEFSQWAFAAVQPLTNALR